MTVPHPPPGGGRRLLPGILIGVLVPAVSFVPALLAVRSGADGSAAYSVGGSVWSLVAFAGVLMTAFDRTRRLGLGILIGFVALVVVGAGTCTAVVMGTPS